VLFAVLAYATAKVTYDGYHSIVIPHVTSDEASIVRSLADTDDRLRQVMLMNDYLLAGMEAHLLVSPQQVEYIENILSQFDIPFVTISTNYQGHIDEVEAANQEAKARYLAKRAAGILQAPDYYTATYSEMKDWMDDMATQFDIVTVTKTGDSYLGAEFHQLNIDGTTVQDPMHVYIDGGIHAREWISPSTMMWIAFEVMSGTSADAVRMRENYVWHIVPCMNPDGYDFTNTNDRLWRKNRRNNEGSSCVGVDLNRNWDQWWDGPGSSPLPCSDTYRGTHGDSEPEVQGVEAQLQSIGGSNIVLYMDVHCYSQLWLTPWSGNTAKPSDYADLLAGGQAAAAAIQAVHGRTFRVGTPPDLLYVANGGSLDWAKAVAGVKYTYAPELRPATAGEGGFVIPPSNINPSGEEIFAGTVANIDYAADNQ
jgi:carboxypeptidase A2